ncbi:glycosyltransferase family 4 protein [Flavobacterium sp. GT3R68]|uniref:glycosyltransferase family 4 protein n=1 Tax=Flavobacterium sp. GT3R68 TaxID=2594437 RepID=UPI000F89A744|nr:glycosyltransferase family 4 protein [Flavobacterium sp. GT3R68]RTY92252.1 glycosyltransferase family 1 protein [Flavobacterium sp. GSN2]TRW92488.1 glycosyltransferase family 4 protein [Flavobacterium sp. GT3R68]
MKIAFLTPEYPHAKTGASGGIGSSIKTLALGLKAQGCSVHVLVYGQKADTIFDDEGITIHQIKNIKLKGLSWYLTRKKLQKTINSLHANNELDILEAPDWTGITSFIQPNCPVVIRLHGSDTYFCHLDNRPVKWLNRFHEKRALQKADKHVSVSAYTAAMTNRLFGLNKNFTIIPNGINIADFKNVSNIISDLPIILYFGTLIRKKGLFELPLIFNKVIEQQPNAQLYLVGRDSADIISGSSSTWEMMQPLFSKGALQNVTYFGGVPFAEIKAHIQKATVCVFPTFAEALPLSWLEAMAMEKAVVASNIGWATEIITDGNSGFLVHPKEHDLFADRIISLLQNLALRKQMELDAHKRVTAIFDVKKVAEKNMTFYKSLIEKH